MLPRADLGSLATLGDAHEWVEDTAVALGVGGETLDRLALATGEAVANAIEHGAGDVRIDLDRSATGWTVCVHDDGPGPLGEGGDLPDDPFAERGRGRFLIRTLADRLTRDAGTLTLWFDARPS